MVVLPPSDPAAAGHDELQGIGSGDDRPEMAELFIQERAAFPHHHRPLYFATREDDGQACKHTAFFRRLMDTGRVRPMPFERLFAVVGDLLYGTILTNLLSGRPADPAAQADDVADVILNGILADGKKAGGKP